MVTVTKPKSKSIKKVKNHVKRMEIYYADMRATTGSEQTGRRPVLIIQNDLGNRFSPTTIVLAISSSMTKAKLPTHVELDPNSTGLEKKSVLLAEQIRTIDELRLLEYVGTVDEETKKKIERALSISVGLIEF